MRFALFTIGLGAGLILTSCSRTPLDISPDQLASVGGTLGTGGKTGAGGSAGGTTSTAAQHCTDHASTQSDLPSQYSGTFVSVDGVDKQYYMQANWWGLFDQQSETVDGLSFSVANPTGATSYSDMPMGYPSLFIGTYAGHATKGSNLPKQVSALTNVYTVFSTNASSKGYSDYNAAYDVWLTATGAPLPTYQYDPGMGGAYLMVWLFKPTDRQPRGRNAHPEQAVHGLPGTWDVWIDSSDPPCISYVSTTPRDRLDFDLNDFIQDSVANDYGITSSMYLSIIFAGFEIWGEGDGLQAKAFCANVL
jgi:hypothetical protein